MSVIKDGSGKGGYVIHVGSTYKTGDTIRFGDPGVYIMFDDFRENPRIGMISGDVVLTYDEYNDYGAYNQHQFFLDDKDLFIIDNNEDEPWGIEVKCGDGNQDKPFTFGVLHDPVTYME